MPKTKLRFYCFSPPVMVATFAVEIAAALYVFFRYKSSRLQKLGIATLLLLATFQLAEYNVCGRFGVAPGFWSRIGYAAIAMLPPLGLHIIYEIGKRKFDRIVAAAYGTGAAFAGLFAFGSVFQDHVCSGNYVIFQLNSPFGGMFFVYYYSWLLVTMYAAFRLVRQKQLTRQRKLALLYAVLGYALFMAPTSLAILVFPETAAALPSIMCGFAVLFALVLTLAVLPHTEKKKPRKRP